MTLEKDIERGLRRIGKTVVDTLTKHVEAQIKGQVDLQQAKLEHANNVIQNMAEQLEHLGKIAAQPRPAPIDRETARLREAYATLGVSPSDNLDMAKAIYYAKAKLLHPDTGRGDEERFKLLDAAYKIVTDDMRRRGGK